MKFGAHSQFENRRAQFGRQRFIVDNKPPRETARFANREQVSPSHTPTAVTEAKMSFRRSTTPHTPAQKPVRTACGFVIGVAVTSLLFAIMSTNFAIDITSPNSALGIRLLFTDAFDYFFGLLPQQSLEIGRLNVMPFPHTSILAHNYASVAMGGRSIPALTSPLYLPPLRLDIPRIDRMFWRFFSPKPTIHPPEMALSGGNNPGECWAFAGSSGQLGIQLVVPIHVTSFAIGHTWNTSFTKSAPRNITLWGLISKVNFTTYETASRPIVPQFGVPHVGIHLASVTFDPKFDPIQGRPHQTFPLLHTTRERFDHLIVQFLGNWGHPDYTCLYQLEIHGSEAGTISV